MYFKYINQPFFYNIHRITPIPVKEDDFTYAYYYLDSLLARLLAPSYAEEVGWNSTSNSVMKINFSMAIKERLEKGNSFQYNHDSLVFFLKQRFRRLLD